MSRPKGTTNKFTATAKQAFNLAFQGMGGIEKLTEWGAEHPTEFFKLYARLIPVDTVHSGSIEHRNIEVDFDGSKADDKSELPAETPTIN